MEEKFSDANDFISRIEEYIQTRIELTKLTVVDKVSSILSNLIAGVIIGIVILLTCIFLSIAASLVISQYFGNSWAGFVIIAGFYLLISLFLLLFKQSLISDPLSNLFIRSMLEETQDDSK
jgi:hypothetical protein